MSHAIIGAGAIGQALATQFARAGIEVLIANSRGPDSLADLAGTLGPTIRPAPVGEALAAAIVILAVPFDAIEATVAPVRDWHGRLAVDASNAIDFPAFTPRDLGGRPSSAVVRDRLPGARLVKAFNTMPAALLAKDPAEGGGRRVVFLSGDEPEANAEAAVLIRRLGFAPIDLGRLAEGGRLQQFGGPFPVHNLIELTA
ncbi:MAG: NADPH-dependent F420 reductase [Alphaproteobacteria bacterium]